jgi:hypothetical protein
VLRAQRAVGASVSLFCFFPPLQQTIMSFVATTPSLILVQKNNGPPVRRPVQLRPNPTVPGLVPIGDFVDDERGEEARLRRMLSPGPPVGTHKLDAR